MEQSVTSCRPGQQAGFPSIAGQTTTQGKLGSHLEHVRVGTENDGGVGARRSFQGRERAKAFFLFEKEISHL